MHFRREVGCAEKLYVLEGQTHIQATTPYAQFKRGSTQQNMRDGLCRKNNIQMRWRDSRTGYDGLEWTWLNHYP